MVYKTGITFVIPKQIKQIKAMLTQRQVLQRKELLRQISFKRVADKVVATDLYIDGRIIRVSIEHKCLYQQVVRYSERNQFFTIKEPTVLRTVCTRKEAMDYIKAIVHSI